MGWAAQSPFSDGGSGGATWGDLLRWAPDPLRTAATETNALARALADEAEDLHFGTTVMGWVGQTQAAAAARRDQLRDDLLEHAADLALCAKALDAAAQDVTALMAAVDAITSDAYLHQITIDSMGTVSDAATPPSLFTAPEAAAAYTSKRQAAVDGLATRVAQALRTAGEIDGRLGAALLQATNGTPSRGTARTADAALAAGAGAYRDDVTSAPAGADDASRAAWLATLGKDDVARVRREHPGWLDPQGLPACTVESQEVTLDGEITVMSLSAKEKAVVAIEQSRAADGTTTWNVKLDATDSAGAKAALGEKASAGGRGVTASADVSAYANRLASTTYTFTDEASARKAYRELLLNPATLLAAHHHTLARAVALTGGPRLPAPAESSLAGEVDGGASAEAKAGGGSLGLGGGAAVGLRRTSKAGGVVEHTTYVKLNGKANASLNDPDISGLKAGLGGTADGTLAITYRGDKVVSMSRTTNYGLDVTSPSWKKEKTTYVPKHAANPPRIAGQSLKGEVTWGGTTSEVWTLDATKSTKNAEAVNETLAAVRRHLSAGAAPEVSEADITAFRRRFDEVGPAEGASATKTTSSTGTVSGTVGVKFGAGFDNELNGTAKHTTKGVVDSSYWDPARRAWVTWANCTPVPVDAAHP